MSSHLKIGNFSIQISFCFSQSKLIIPYKLLPSLCIFFNLYLPSFNHQESQNHQRYLYCLEMSKANICCYKGYADSEFTVYNG